jgi:hypothetical protein
MEKIVEALTKLLPEDAVADVTEAVKTELESAKQSLENEFNTKLEEAYAELSDELKGAEETAIKGYKEAYAIIQDLRARLETQQKEFESSMEEGYEEAYQMLQAEKAKNENLEVEMYDSFDKKLQEMKEYMVDKVDQFLQYKGTEIYESARKELESDPRTSEHKVTLEKIVEAVANYIGEDGIVATDSGKIEELARKSEEIKAQVKILEARNIRLSAENTKLTEAVRESQKVITESVRAEKKERTERAKNVQGRGRAVNEAEVVAEWTGDKTTKPAKANNVDNTLVESIDPDLLRQMQVLAGTKKED